MELYSIVVFLRAPHSMQFFLAAAACDAAILLRRRKRSAKNSRGIFPVPTQDSDTSRAVAIFCRVA
jgi:hypothetical protein